MAEYRCAPACTACLPACLPSWQSAGAPSPACWPARLRACSVLPPADSLGKWRGASQLQPAALGRATQHARCDAAACAWRCIGPWRRKKFELPNGTGLAVSAGLQYVGSKPLPRVWVKGGGILLPVLRGHEGQAAAAGRAQVWHWRHVLLALRCQDCHSEPGCLPACCCLPGLQRAIPDLWETSSAPHCLRSCSLAGLGAAAATW